MKTKIAAYISSMLIALMFCVSGGYASGNDSTTPQINDYNIIWDSPSKDQSGSMPVGNGDIGLNVWVEENGDVCFYIGKTDTWGDNARLLKVGKVRVKCEPAILFPGAEFKQELDLKTGTVLISSAGKYKGKQTNFNIQVWIDANHPVIHINNQSDTPLTMSANIELWRTEPYSLPEITVSDLESDQTVKPSRLHAPVIVEPDNIIKGSSDYIGWYHHNIKSAGFDMTNKLQGLSEYFTSDPILHRTFGAIITGTEARRIDDSTLQTASAKTSHLNVYLLTKHPSQPDEWLKGIEALADKTEAISFNKRQKAHIKWWNEFWDRSWIYATEADTSKLSKADNDAFIVSRAYTLQRFIDACAGRGQYPIKFNGSLFTVYPTSLPPGRKITPGGADYRKHGPGYWWQNTRLPYISMCASGDFDLMQPLFNMYAGEVFELCKFRTRKYFGFDGAFFPECTYFWGSNFTVTYGWTPYEDREDKLQESKWHKWEWVSGLELVFMMLNNYDYTQDKDFLNDKIIPVANEVIKFFDNFYKTNESGKMVMYPSMACETWWDCTNPMPELAGLHGVTKRLLALPTDLTSKKDREFWSTIRSKLPAIPLRDTPSGKALAPAERFEIKHNSESPELYAVFPFRLFGVGKDNLDWGKNALEHRWISKYTSSGWTQDDIFMTYLGLAEQAKEHIVTRSNTYDTGSRFPAFWGPNHDWIPDQDHGGVMMKAFQSMLVQADPYSKKIYITPAWPKEWNADFKLHAPYNTIIEGSVKNGKIESLKVTPSSRKEDVIIKN